MEFSGKLDIESLNEQSYKTAYIGFICKRRNEYLLRERISGNLRIYKFPGFKPLLGENMKDARKRLFFEATGLDLADMNFRYRSTHFKIQLTSENEVLFDDVLILYDVDTSRHKGEEINLKEGNKWFTLEEIKKLKGKWPEIDLTLLNKKQNMIYEYSFINNYNLEDL